jgi:cytochrome c553
VTVRVAFYGGEPDGGELLARVRTTRVVLATAHRHDPTNNRSRNLAALCQRCHMRHDRAEHQRRRWLLTLFRRRASGDLFLGRHP